MNLDRRSQINRSMGPMAKVVTFCNTVTLHVRHSAPESLTCDEYNTPELLELVRLGVKAVMYFFLSSFSLAHLSSRKEERLYV